MESNRRPGQAIPRGDCCAAPIELNPEGRYPVWVHVTPPADGHQVRRGGLIPDSSWPAHQPSHKLQVDRHFAGRAGGYLLPEERDE